MRLGLRAGGWVVYGDYAQNCTEIAHTQLTLSGTSVNIGDMRRVHVTKTRMENFSPKLTTMVCAAMTLCAANAQASIAAKLPWVVDGAEIIVEGVVESTDDNGTWGRSKLKVSKVFKAMRVLMVQTVDSLEAFFA